MADHDGHVDQSGHAGFEGGKSMENATASIRTFDTPGTQLSGAPEVEHIGVPQIQKVEVPRVQSVEIPQIQKVDIPRISRREK